MVSSSFKRPLRIGIDATPLFGQPTGVGAVTKSIVDRVEDSSEIDLTLVLVSWNAKRLLDSSPIVRGRDVRSVRYPARAVHQLWQYFDHPAVTGFDVVHGTNFVVPPGGGASELVTIHDLTAWHMPELVSSYSLAYPKLVDRAIGRGAHIHAVSQAVADEVISTISIEPGRVHVIPNGLDFSPNDLDGQKPKLARAGRKLAGGEYVLCLGTIEPRKDHPGLLKAMRLVWAEQPDIKLVVAGGDGWGVQAYEQAVSDLGLIDDSRIIRMGYVTDDERLSLLAGAECLAYPSLYEGFGLPPLEAMALGTPVVATEIPAVAEVCEDAAVLVPVRDADALAAGILNVLDNGAARFDALGRKRVEAYNWDRSVKQLLTLYHQLADGA